VGEGLIAYQFGDQRLSLTLHSDPIPWAELEAPCAAAWWWPDAASRMQAHTHHVVASLSGGESPPLEQALRLTHLVAAFASDADAVGVFWTSGGVVQEARNFIKLATGVHPDRLETPLWVSVQVQPLEGGGHSFYTTGVAAFGLMELESACCLWGPREIHRGMAGLSAYVLRQGDNIPDGDTVGRSEHERVQVKHRRSMVGRHTVMKLVFPKENRK
jgi:hypothetical protein